MMGFTFNFLRFSVLHQSCVTSVIKEEEKQPLFVKYKNSVENTEIWENRAVK